MASSSLLYPLLIFFFFLHSHATSSPFTSIFSFGDSLADTGNFLVSGAFAFPSISRLPYGETYFGRPTGRCSDGRLVVDFIAQKFGIPLLPPYLAHSAGKDFRQGANFAVAGATALDISFFEKQQISYLWTNNSLSIQLNWFKELLPSLCTPGKDCHDYFKKSLFLVGEIGGNDYNFAFFSGKSMEEARAYVPFVVRAIATVVNSLIKLGAKELLVPGNLPVGCSAMFLNLFRSPAKEDYDPITGCLNGFNEFVKYHNEQLKQALKRISHKHPRAKIIYADYYNAGMSVIQSKHKFGFDEGDLSACCGGGGPYNFNLSARCGHPGAKACDNPSMYINWDGIHLTEAAYKYLTATLLQGPYTDPPMPWLQP